MTPRTLFIIIIKVLGILSLKSLLISIPQLALVILPFFGGDFSGGILMIFFSLLVVGLNLWISHTLIFRAEWLVTKLGLAEGIQEQNLQLNINTSSILRIAIIVTAFLILVFEIPDFVQIVYSLLRQRDISFYDMEKPDWTPAIFSGIKIIIAFLLIGERKRILEFLERKPELEKKSGDDIGGEES